MYLTVAQAADRLQGCKKTIFRRIQDGSIPAHALISKTLRIDEKDLEAYMDAHKYDR